MSVAAAWRLVGRGRDHRHEDGCGSSLAEGAPRDDPASGTMMDRQTWDAPFGSYAPLGPVGSAPLLLLISCSGQPRRGRRRRRAAEAAAAPAAAVAVTDGHRVEKADGRQRPRRRQRRAIVHRRDPLAGHRGTPVRPFQRGAGRERGPSAVHDRCAHGRSAAQASRSGAGARTPPRARAAKRNACGWPVLLKDGLIPQADYDAQAASAATFQAVDRRRHGADRQREASAAVHDDSWRRSPGAPARCSSIPGALVRANDTTPLVVINQMAPVFVSFAVPARLLPQIRAEQARRQLDGRGGARRQRRARPRRPAPSPSSTTRSTRRPARSGSRRRSRTATGGSGRARSSRSRCSSSVEPTRIVVPAAAVQTGQQGSSCTW